MVSPSEWGSWGASAPSQFFSSFLQYRAYFRHNLAPPLTEWCRHQSGGAWGASAPQTFSPFLKYCAFFKRNLAPPLTKWCRHQRRHQRGSWGGLSPPHHCMRSCPNFAVYLPVPDSLPGEGRKYSDFVGLFAI